MATVDLSGPSPDTGVLAHQWLAVLKGATLVPGSFFADQKATAPVAYVAAVASIVGHGTAYWPVGTITPSMLKKAQKIGSGDLSDILAESLKTGEPLYARSLGVASESCVGSTGPKS